MFSGLRSRWTTPTAWAAASAEAICRKIGSAREIGSPPAAKSSPRVLALELLHHAVGAVAAVGRGLDEVEDLDDVPVVDLVDRARLAEEALHEPLVEGVLRAEHLDRDLPPEGLVPGGEDPAHRPFADQLQQLVAAEVIADLLGNERGARHRRIRECRAYRFTASGPTGHASRNEQAGGRAFEKPNGRSFVWGAYENAPRRHAAARRPPRPRARRGHRRLRDRPALHLPERRPLRAGRHRLHREGRRPAAQPRPQPAALARARADPTPDADLPLRAARAHHPGGAPERAALQGRGLPRRHHRRPPLPVHRVPGELPLRARRLAGAGAGRSAPRSRSATRRSSSPRSRGAPTRSSPTSGWWSR